MIGLMKLTTEQEAWLTAHIESGEFSSPEDALARFIDERIAEESDDDMAWAKPDFDEGMAQLTRGEFLTLEEHNAQVDKQFAAFNSLKS